MTSAARVAIGIDVGGTFTDLVALHADGRVQTVKVLSVPGDRAAGVLHALESASVAPADIAHIAHGTTVVTNLLLERRGARVVACATAGFTDLLELRRQERAALYDLTQQHPAPLVDAAHVVGVDERLAPGTVVRALDSAALAAAVDAVLAHAPETVAITLLHAYENSSHERAVAEGIRQAALARGVDVDVICSHDILPEIREYERMATTVAEAYARPAVRRYLGGLTERLTQKEFPAPRVMTSAGGTLSASAASQQAASLALSGPAGGVTGAGAFVRVLGESRALTIDIGGTSADVGLIDDGEPLVERGGGVGGVPIALPRVLVEAVAAGGGSIAWLDDGGALRTGPESAGADPGPAAYGRGGVRPTVTDAHVVCGTIRAGAWSGGVTIDHARAAAAIEPIAESLGVSTLRAAQAIIATADATMARALRRISVERGIDPRDIPLVAFGGGGPLHACGLADQIGMRRVIVPPHAGVLSALGLAMAPERRERLTNCVVEAAQWSDNAMRQLLGETRDALRGALRGDNSHVTWWMRSRYVGQGYELDVPVELQDSVGDVAARFEARHQARAGFTLSRPVEFISLRTTVSSNPWPAVFARGTPSSTAVGTGELPNDRDDGRAMSRELEGPCVVQLPDATMLVTAGWRARSLDVGGWMLERIA
ncbi:MAG: hydantoinase/oxoprolinase family protein [Gemmatimonadaceae bacterium]|nr:hydantoinase/oxoprolinase family protein [Gemmatimonadaceae bacterium]